MSLEDFATELINDAKTSSEAEETVFKLEQLREVVLHREKFLLPVVFSGVVDLMTRSSVKIKKFLVKFGADALVRAPVIVPDFLTLYGYFAGDSNDMIRKTVVIQLSRLYDKVAMAIVNTNAGASKGSSNSSSSGFLSVTTLWSNFQAIVAKVTTVISDGGSGNDAMTVECMKLLDSALYFGFPLHDSRGKVGGSQQSSGDGANVFTVGDVPLHHPFINRQEIEQETEALFGKLVLWLTRGGATSSSGAAHVFAPTVAFTLGCMIAKVTVERPAALRLLSAAKALTTYVSSLNKTDNGLDLISRDNLSRLTRKILALAGDQTSSDDKVHYSKLKAALDTFDKETVSRNTSSIVSDPRRRGRGAQAQVAKVVVPVSAVVDSSSGDAEDTEITAQMHESALEAVNLMEAKVKHKAALLEASLSASAAASSVGSKSAGSLQTTTDTLDTMEFGWDILKEIGDTTSTIMPQDLTQSKLIALHLQQRAGATKQSNITVKSNSVMVNVVENQYQNIALYNMENYISQLYDFRRGGRGTGK